MQRLCTQLNRVPLRLIPLALMLVLVISIIGPSAVRADPGWYDSDWLYRKKITINSENVSGSSSLPNFPVLIQIVDTDLRDDALDNANDILFTLGNGETRVSHEIESFNGTTGNLTAWVEIPSLSATVDTDIYMYYGNSGVASSSENATGVWDNADYKMVQHLEETSGGANAITDSTLNNNDGTDSNNPTFGSAGQMDGAITFDGSDDNIYKSSPSFIDDTQGTVEAWVKFTDLAQSHAVVNVNVEGASDDEYLFMYYRGSGENYVIRIYLGINGTTTMYAKTRDNIITTTDWHYWVVTSDGSTLRAYLDGQEETLTFTTGSNTGQWFDDATDADVFTLGALRRAAISIPFEGILDEVRISATARDVNWIKTSYNNQSNPGNFLTVGSEETEAAAPTAVGGLVLPVNKASVLAPWLFLCLVLSLVIARIVIHIRKRRSPR